MRQISKWSGISLALIMGLFISFAVFHHMYAAKYQGLAKCQVTPKEQHSVIKSE